MSKPYDYALVIGRFQPLCLNHTELFSVGFGLADKLILCVGTADYGLAKKTILNRDNRHRRMCYEVYKRKYIFGKEMVFNFIEKYDYLKDKPYELVEIQDILDIDSYEEHLNKQVFIKTGISLKDSLNIIIGENYDTLKCFKNIDKLTPKIFINNFHASDVRIEIRETGNSERLACKLTKEEINLIKESEA